MRFVIRLLGTMLGIWVSTLLVSSIHVVEGTSVTDTLLIFAAIAVVLTVINGVIRPVIEVLAFPLYLLTFGLFALVTNALVFWLTGWASTALGLPFVTGGFWSSLLGGTITAIISAIVVAVLGSNEKRSRDR